MRRPRSAPTDSHGPSRDRWLVSYADYVTLLLAFFVTIYAISRMDNNKLIQAQDSIQRALNAPVFLGGFPVEPGVGVHTTPGIRGDLPAASLRAAPQTQIEEVSRLVQENLQDMTDFRDIRLMVTGTMRAGKIQDHHRHPPGGNLGRRYSGALCPVCGRKCHQGV
jgi:flagellar motor protein MotB